MSWNKRQYLIAFNMVPSIGGRRLLALQEHFGSLKRAWHAQKSELIQVKGIGEKIATDFCKNRQEISPIAEENWAEKLGARIITIEDGDYPTYLRRLVVPPPVIYVRGKLPPHAGIAVVGTRKASRIGIAQARQFSNYLVSHGIPVISGLARGIDYFAHEQVVSKGGMAVAVLGSNLANLYPSEHLNLANKIIKNGAVITEFSSNCSTVPGNFPRRNRIIAGCSSGVLVVQAGAKSGAIHTADWALELGIDVWAIPGEISDPLRQGCHRLIKQGAALITNPTEMLEDRVVKDEVAVSLESLLKAGLHANEIAVTLNKPISEILAEISLLQLQKGSHI